MAGRFLEALKRKVLVFDGAMGSNLQALGLSKADFGGKEGCNDYLCVTRPEVVSRIHRGFLEVGCDVVETNSFGSTRLKLDEYGLGDRIREVNLACCRVAREAADAFSTAAHPRYVAGSLGPTGMLPSSNDPSLGKITLEELEQIYREQAEILIEGGADALLVETSQDILEVRAAILGCRAARKASQSDVAIMAQVTLDQTGRMLLGTDIRAALTTIEAMKADVVGLNCSTGPKEMVDSIRYLSERSSLPISCIPNAGIPENRGDGIACYPLTPAELARYHRRFVEEYAIEVVGGCCGTTFEHLRAVVEAVGARAPRPRTPRREPMVSSGMTAIPLRQEPAPLLVGERVNSQGSRKVKQLLLKDDYRAICDVGREQADGGAHVLDVCVALTERADEKEQMRRVVKELSLAVAAPLVVDSTEADVIGAALNQLPGRGIVNSINLENGRKRVDAVLPHVVRHGAAVVALTIDESGMAKSRDLKLAVARRIHDIATQEFGLAPGDLIFDALTFTLATGSDEFRRSAIETIDGIRAIKRELPGVFTILGVSNVSFGLSPPARAALNSVFLHHCVAAGLDLAIVNPREITPYAEIGEEERALCDDLVFDRRADALPRLIERFEGVKGQRGKKEDKAKEVLSLPAEQRIHQQILRRIPDGIEEALADAMTRRTPVQVINELLLPAMKDVGDRFGAGELILPFVLQSAEVMKRAVAYVERFLAHDDSTVKGKVVLATVFGDVHDIGKNLVKTILANNGYQVFDLGKQCPVSVILEKAVTEKADAIGLSALLVSTSKQMPICVAELAKAGLEIPVLIGGAAINRPFGARANVLDGGALYAPGVFYCKDAFEGLDTVNALKRPETARALRARLRAELERTLARPALEVGRPASPGAVARSEVPPAPDVPAPPFWGARTVAGIDLGEVFPLMDHRSLFKLSWGVRGVGEAEYERLLETEFRPRLEALEREAVERGLLEAQAVYGYFACGADGDALVVFEGPGSSRQVARFEFPRQAGRERLCLADYFRPVAAAGGGEDVLCLQVVTVGRHATEECERLQAEGEFSKAYFLHGLAVQAAEGLAEWMNARVRRELEIEKPRGLRYSPGYPACPDLEGNRLFFDLLDPERAIGVRLTEGFQLDPEQSTNALIVHHPRAKYFTMNVAAEPAERLAPGAPAV